MIKAYLHSAEQAEISLLLEHALAHRRQAIRADPVYGPLLLFQLVDLKLLQCC